MKDSKEMHELKKHVVHKVPLRKRWDNWVNGMKERYAKKTPPVKVVEPPVEWDRLQNVQMFRKELQKRIKEEKKLERKKHTLKFYLPKAGIFMESDAFFRILFIITTALNIVLTISFIWYFMTYRGFGILYILLMLFLLWTVGFVISFFIVWAGAFFYIDVMMFRRRVEIEKVLPDFLLLTASNIKAGMTIDQALWYAVRPRFGVLAHEIEIVAKETMTGEDLKKALHKFARKYDSPVLSRTISLITEGIDAGGKMGDLLTKIATNLQESDLVRKEMAANVTTYIIFITFATIIAAPFLFALSTQMIDVVTGLTSSIDLTQATGLSAPVKVGTGGIEIGDFRVFVFVTMALGSFISAMIISVIKNGTVKQGLGYIPAFIAVSFMVYIVANFLLGSVFSGFF